MTLLEIAQAPMDVLDARYALVIERVYKGDSRAHSERMRERQELRRLEDEIDARIKAEP
jgi:hypothetical protein